MMKTVLFKDALLKYKNSVSILKKGYEQERYRIEQLCRSSLANKVTSKITSVDIAEHRDARLTDINPRTNKALSPASVRLEMSLLSSVFDICRIEWGYCEANPVTNVRKPKPSPGRERRLTAREEKQILRYAHNHKNKDVYAIVVFALETAMRQGEILNLKWENINLKTRIAHLPETKNGSKRDVPLSIAARDVLISMGVKSKGRVFGYTKFGIKSTWRFMMIKLGIEDLHFHDLRHEAISRLFEKGSLEMMEIAAISGHKSLSMLKRYTHLKAQKLVSKLEGNKNKGRQVIMNHMIPYPAKVDSLENKFRLTLLDFEDVYIESEELDEAIKSAENVLLRLIFGRIRESKTIPSPDQYLEIIDEKQLVMIDPMANFSF